MIKSMTGFGRAEAVSRERKVSVELKSVNHRYLDLNIKMPKRLSYFEGEIRNVMKTISAAAKSMCSSPMKTIQWAEWL